VLLVLGGLFLFDDASGAEVSLGVLLPVAIVAGAAVIFAGRFAWRARHGPLHSGSDMFTGRLVDVRRADGTVGEALVDGTWWRLSSSGPPLHEGDRVRVTAMEGLTLVVEHVDDGATVDSQDSTQGETP
jgi:membrane-bound serine protease (ClpP class)